MHVCECILRLKTSPDRLSWSSLQFFTFEQYKKLLSFTPLSHAMVSHLIQARYMHTHTHSHWYYTQSHSQSSEALSSLHGVLAVETKCNEMNAAQWSMWKIAHYFDSSLSMWKQNWWLSPPAALESMASSNSQEEAKRSPALSITPVSARSS